AAAFTAQTNLTALNFINASVPWTPKPWKANERLEPEQTRTFNADGTVSQDLSGLVEAIVKKQGYTPDSAIAFVIKGTGKRIARALDSATAFPAPALVVKYTPRKYTTEFLACGNPNDAVNVCGQKVQGNVTGIAQTCKLANECKCSVKEAPDEDSFSAACNASCDLKPLQDCSADDIAQVTAAPGSSQPVCVAHSPLGSALFQRLTTCEIVGSSNCSDLSEIDPTQDQSCVSVRVFKGSDSLTRVSTPRGRIEFAETDCGTPNSRCFGLTHRVHIGNMTFKSGSFIDFLFDGEHTIFELPGVGASTVNTPLNKDSGAGSFGGPSIKHSVRGREGNDTLALFRAGDAAEPINVDLGGFKPNGTCSLKGWVLKTGNLEMLANIKGKLVNQPPTVELDAGPHTFECNAKDPSRGVFSLDPVVKDPENNIASFAWFRGSRKGTYVAGVQSPDVEQPLTVGSEPPTEY